MERAFRNEFKYEYFIVSLLLVVFTNSFTGFADESLVDLAQHALNVKAAGSPSQMNLGIVSTWRGHSESWANSWLRYHISVGFSRIYLFFDDPEFDEELIKTLSSSKEYKPFLTIIKSDSTYRKKYWTFSKSKKSDPEYYLLHAFGVYWKTDINSRQILNVARAGVLAKSEDLNWLLHIDSDELFWIERLKTGIARSFFSQLHYNKITHLALLNDEVVPTTPNFYYKKRPKDPFHQRTYFKRNILSLNGNQNQVAGQWSHERGVRFFLGYMCGKGAINVKLWRKNQGENFPIMPQDVVAFAFNSWQPGNITLMNKSPQDILPYVSSSKVKVAVVSHVARILHYVNPDFDALKKKFTARKKFNNKNYDIDLVTEKRKKLYEKTRDYWATAETMPSWEFYNEMWSRVQTSVKLANDKTAYDYYLRSAVAEKGKLLDKYLAAGIIYRNEMVYKFLTKIEKIRQKQKEDKGSLFIDLSTGFKFVDGGSGEKGGNRTYVFYSCKDKAPHFSCDIQNCCGFLTVPQLTFTKRLLGYKRYARLQWWKPGLNWTGK